MENRTKQKSIINPRHLHKFDAYLIEADAILKEEGKPYAIERLLGRGKGGYSFLVNIVDERFVLKIAHYEKVDYYDFGKNNKIELEAKAYLTLAEAGIAVPRLICAMPEKNYLIKEYINGNLAMDLIANDQVTDDLFKQLFDYSKRGQKRNFNIDFFPANFVLAQKRLFYVDYEISPYSYEWGLENWGLPYWCNSGGMSNFLQSQEISELNVSMGIPYRDENINKRIELLVKRFGNC